MLLYLEPFDKSLGTMVTFKQPVCFSLASARIFLVFALLQVGWKVISDYIKIIEMYTPEVLGTVQSDLVTCDWGLQSHFNIFWMILVYVSLLGWPATWNFDLNFLTVFWK